MYLDINDCSYTSIYFKLFGIFSIQQKTNNCTSVVYSIRYFYFFLIAIEARGFRHVTTGALLIGLQQGGWASRFRKEANSDSRYYSPLQNLSPS